MQFKDIIGQKKLIETLCDRFNNNRLPHAILLLGKQGGEALPIARALAQYVNCISPDSYDACGSCISCLQAQKNIHPDIHFTYPVVRQKAGASTKSIDYISLWRKQLTSQPYMVLSDWMETISADHKQPNITVRECHQIINQLSLNAFSGKYKVQIIWMAEYLKLAANVLLKVLEEPPPSTIFILIAQNKEDILDTILSRTQMYLVPPIDDRDMLQALLNRGVEPSRAETITRLSEGHIYEALSMLSVEKDTSASNFYTWVELCTKAGIKEDVSIVSTLVNWTEQISRLAKEEQKLLIKYGLFFFRQSIYIQQNIPTRLKNKEWEIAKYFAHKISISQFIDIQDMLNKLYYYIERNAHVRLLYLHNSILFSRLLNNKEGVREVLA